MELTKDLKKKIIEYWFETKSLIKIRRRLSVELAVPLRKVPGSSTLRYIIDKFVKEGELNRLNKGRSGHKRVVRVDEHVNRVQQSVTEAPRLSCRRRSQVLGMRKTSVHTILRNDLKLTPYVIPIKQSLSRQDAVAREAMAGWFLGMMENDPAWIQHVWFSDETHFYLHSNINKRTNVYWGMEKPTIVNQRPLHSPKVTAWCALSSTGIIGPFFFEDQRGVTVNVDQQSYGSVFKLFVRALGRKVGDLHTEWYQQDGATPHCAINTLALLRRSFGNRIISRRTDTPWAPHSPDLNPLDFFLWGYSKDRVYENSPQTTDELKQEIRRVVRGVTVDACRNTIENFTKRVKLCIQQKGMHFEQLL